MSAKFAGTAAPPTSASVSRPQTEVQFLKQVLGQLRKGDVAGVRRAEGSIEARIKRLEASALE